MKKVVFICVLLLAPSFAFSFPFRGVEQGKEPLDEFVEGSCILDGENSIKVLKSGDRT